MTPAFALACVSRASGMALACVAGVKSKKQPLV
jgi:hypothetical protein